MESEIRNRVKESGLIALDLADFRPLETIVGIDISDHLWQGLVLKEKDFRQWIRENDWNSYSGKAVYIHCSQDAIIPTWAYILVASALDGITHTIRVGSRNDLERKLVEERIAAFDVTPFRDGMIIIKGCSEIVSPEFAMSQLVLRLQQVAKSIMYGEPCSTVPLFKRRK